MPIHCYTGRRFCRLRQTPSKKHTKAMLENVNIVNVYSQEETLIKLTLDELKLTRSFLAIYTLYMKLNDQSCLLSTEIQHELLNLKKCFSVKGTWKHFHPC